MSLNNYAENLGKRNIITFALIELKREIKEDLVFVLKAKTHILNALRKHQLLDFRAVKCFIQIKTEKIEEL